MNMKDWLATGEDSFGDGGKKFLSRDKKGKAEGCGDVPPLMARPGRRKVDSETLSSAASSPPLSSHPRRAEPGGPEREGSLHRSQSETSAEREYRNAQSAGASYVTGRVAPEETNRQIAT